MEDGFREVSSSTHAAVVHVIRDLFADICQLEEFSFCTSIVVLCGEFSVFSRLVSQIVRVLMHRALPLLSCVLASSYAVVSAWADDRSWTLTQRLGEG